jgi:hypothetical protein
MCCLAGVLLMNCASTGSDGNNIQPVNDIILGDLYIDNNTGFSMYIQS